MASRVAVINRQRDASRRIAAALGITPPNARYGTDYQNAVLLEMVAAELERRNIKTPKGTDHAGS